MKQRFFLINFLDNMALMNYIYVRHDKNIISTVQEERVMALARWTPYRDLMSVRDEMNRVFNEAFGRGTNDVMHRLKAIHRNCRASRKMTSISS